MQRAVLSPVERQEERARISVLKDESYRLPGVVQLRQAKPEAEQDSSAERTTAYQRLQQPKQHRDVVWTEEQS